MTPSRSPSFEDRTPPGVESFSDSTSGCQDVTVNRTNSEVPQVEPKEVEGTPDGAERQEAGSKAVQTQDEQETQGTGDQQAEDNQTAGGQKDTRESAMQEPIAEGQSTQGRGSGKMLTPSLDEGQNGPSKANNAVDLETIPEQIRFFDVQFDQSSKEYTVSRRHENVPDWYGLDHESEFTTQDETFRRGDIVHI